MKHTRVMLLLLILALILSACGGEEAAQPQEPYTCSAGGYTVTVDPINRTITHKEDVYTYTISTSNDKTDYTIRYPNGGVYHWTQEEYTGYGGWNGYYDEAGYISGDYLLSVLRDLPESKRQEHHADAPQGLIYGIALLLIGVLCVGVPELSFYANYGWAIKDAEPSELYLGWTKAIGILFVVVGFLMTMVSIILFLC